jgi:hypothetical protein
LIQAKMHKLCIGTLAGAAIAVNPDHLDTRAGMAENRRVSRTADV